MGLAAARTCHLPSQCRSFPSLAKLTAAPYGRAQVHEKSILLPLLPITLLAATEPAAALWAPIVGCFSMYPLLVRDGAAAAYCGTIALYLVALWPAVRRLLAVPGQGGKGKPKGQAPKAGPFSDLLAWGKARHDVLGMMGLLGVLAMHAARELVEPPARLPWLHDRACITASFGFFALLGLYLQVRQWQVPAAQLVGAGKKGSKGA